MNLANPVIVQSDMSVLLEVMNPLFEEARDTLSLFAELQKSPEYIHTYKITPLSLWNACSGGIDGAMAVDMLAKYSKHPLPESVIQHILDYSGRYGKVRLVKEGGLLFIECDVPHIITELRASKEVMQFCLGGSLSDRIPVNREYRGHIKQALTNMGYPADDMAGYEEADQFAVPVKEVTGMGEKFSLRPYQIQAAEAFYAGGSSAGGSGVIVLPCGAGKTVVGIAVMEKVSTETLILTTSVTAVRQWKRELLDKTSLDEQDVGEYSGDVKEIRPVTVATYQILTSRKNKESEFVHFKLFDERNWGLIVYDEVHMLPAPVLRVTAEIQAKRRIGLTATLIREDGLEKDVFSLIGPRKYDLPWKALEKDGYIASAYCTEIRVPLVGSSRMDYAVADARNKFRIASENIAKIQVVKNLLEKHQNDNVLIIGQYIQQLELIAQHISAPVITGSVKNREREKLYNAFRTGESKVIIVSKVANFAIDLPDANVLIEISGMFGSRQEEAQRLGRILRPKPNENVAWFYTVVSHDTKEQEFATKRQLFLTEQGYKYTIVFAEDL